MELRAEGERREEGAEGAGKGGAALVVPYLIIVRFPAPRLMLQLLSERCPEVVSRGWRFYSSIGLALSLLIF